MVDILTTYLQTPIIIFFHIKNLLEATFVYAVEIAFQSKRKSQAFDNIKNAKNDRWDPCQFTF